jgi:hypothetical protein
MMRGLWQETDRAKSTSKNRELGGSILFFGCSAMVGHYLQTRLVGFRLCIEIELIAWA